ncbi:MAG: PorT family protein [Bacteroidetes bacterium]|nr:PorT family protein [Bacteroidota bacterium]
MKKIIAFTTGFLFGWSVSAQEIPSQTRGIEKSAAVGVEYRIKAGIALGGISPLPLPEEIRSIEGFNPGLNLSVEGEMLKLFKDKWGLAFGLRLETRGMSTDAKVKNYWTVMQLEGQQMQGYFWGGVKTDVNNSFLTLPVSAVWKFNERWGVKFGGYGSYALKRSFSGSTYDGYFRAETPTGIYFEIDEINYDFSNDMRKWYWGLQAGGEWRAFSHLIVSVDLSWGMNSIFNKEFEAIAFKMFPIYGTLSFGYTF